MGACDSPGKTQSESGAPTGGLGGEEGLHQPVPRRWRQVRAAVTDPDLDTIDDDLLAHVRAIGKLFKDELPNVRGRGLLLAVELGQPAGPVAHELLAKGLLVGTAGDTALRLTPSLTISHDEAQQAIAILREVLA